MDQSGHSKCVSRSSHRNYWRFHRVRKDSLGYIIDQECLRKGAHKVRKPKLTELPKVHFRIAGCLQRRSPCCPPYNKVACQWPEHADIATYSTVSSFYRSPLGNNRYIRQYFTKYCPNWSRSKVADNLEYRICAYECTYIPDFATI